MEESHLPPMPRQAQGREEEMIHFTVAEFSVGIVLVIFSVFAAGFAIGYSDGQDRPKGISK